jgi:phosphatidylcholine synthase
VRETLPDGPPATSTSDHVAAGHDTVGTSTTAPAPDAPVTFGQRVGAYAVHAFTASGVVFAFLAAAEACSPDPDPRAAFLYLLVQVLIDSADGPLARAMHVKVRAPRIDGRTIDDIVDYLTYTFVPLLLVWRMNWVPAPAGLWVALAMTASLFGFANTGAKDEGGGFFLGFPSYWNIVAFYAGLWVAMFGPWFNAIFIVVLTILTVLPVRFVYPNLAPPPWKWPNMAGALAWCAILLWMLTRYPHVPAWVTWVSLIYPAFYLALSAWLDVRSRSASPRS